MGYISKNGTPIENLVHLKSKMFSSTIDEHRPFTPAPIIHQDGLTYINCAAKILGNGTYCFKSLNVRR